MGVDAGRVGTELLVGADICWGAAHGDIEDGWDWKEFDDDEFVSKCCWVGGADAKLDTGGLCS